MVVNDDDDDVADIAGGGGGRGPSCADAVSTVAPVTFVNLKV